MEKVDERSFSTIRDLQKVKANKGVIDIKADDIVFIPRDKMSPQFWRLGRVLKVFTSRDDKVHATEVRVVKTEHIIRRPVNKLYLLNLNPHEEPKPCRGNLKLNVIQQLLVNLSVVV